jgi:hypothetical protein
MTVWGGLGYSVTTGGTALRSSGFRCEVLLLAEALSAFPPLEPRSAIGRMHCDDAHAGDRDRQHRHVMQVPARPLPSACMRKASCGDRSETTARQSTGFSHAA